MSSNLRFAIAPSSQNDDCSLDSTQPLWPVYPATSPFVTTVGGLFMNNPATSKAGPSICKEYPCATGGTSDLVPAMLSNSYWTSGGGFSDYVPMPGFQAKAVGAYLASAKNLPPSQFFNSSNRGYPDVAQMGTNVLIEMVCFCFACLIRTSLFVCLFICLFVL